jgi:replicative superfamily II helicase
LHDACGVRYEKATALITRAVAQGRGDEIGTVIIDEMQMIGEGDGDSCRGALLETMLLKLLHFCPQVLHLHTPSLFCPS